MAADGHLGMTALSRVTLASAGLFLFSFAKVRKRVESRDLRFRSFLTASSLQRLSNVEVNKKV